MVVRVPIRRKMLVWARERAGVSLDDLLGQFPRLKDWESETLHPTLKQLEGFARAVHVPFGYLFLPDPPDEPVPLPDFRTINSHSVTKPSPNLLDTVYACRERQAWFKGYAKDYGIKKLDFVGSATLSDTPQLVAEEISELLEFRVNDRVAIADVDASMRAFVRQAEISGVLVMISGIVGSNTRRILDAKEFRGFAISDPIAPLIFINGVDAKSARLFTLAHELAHIWLGVSALSDMGAAPNENVREEEVWCNQVAAELLMPSKVLKDDVPAAASLDDLVPWLRRKYKVSTLVVLRRLLDIGHLDRKAFDTAWSREIGLLRSMDSKKSSSGGNFYSTTASRVGRRFARAVYNSTLEGQTLYRDAHRLLGISKTETFNEFGRVIGAIL